MPAPDFPSSVDDTVGVPLCPPMDAPPGIPESEPEGLGDPPSHTLIFPRHATCEAGPLHTGTRHPGLPTVNLAGAPNLLPRDRRRSTAVLLIGKGPGVEEDATGLPFTGPSGVYVRELYAEWSGVGALADLYLTNAVRCRLPDSPGVPPACVNACQQHLARDVQMLCAAYPTVVLWLAGHEACRAVLGRSFGDSLSQQGTTITWAGCRVTVFIINNPAALYPKRGGCRARAVRLHLLLLRRWLEDPTQLWREKCTTAVPYEAALHLPSMQRARGHLLSLDIETYGAVQGRPPQTTFQAPMAQALDGVPPDQLVVSAAAAWWDGDALRHCCWSFRRSAPDDPQFRAFLDCFRVLGSSDTTITLTGANIALFDMAWLRATGPDAQEVFNRRQFRLECLFVLNFLDDEERPERGLKSISRVLGVADYGDALDLEVQRYSGPDDLRLLRYNTLDATGELLARDLLAESILTEYGPSKLRTAEWYSDLLWWLIDMHEAGIAYDGEALTAAIAQHSAELAQLQQDLRERGVLVTGAGSRASRQAFFGEAYAAAGLLPMHTDTGLLVTDAETIGLLQERLAPDSPIRKTLDSLTAYDHLRKLVGTYFTPLLLDDIQRKPTKTGKPPKRRKRRQTYPRDGLLWAHPRWYYVPSTDQGRGGTRQVRLAAQAPATQQQTPPIWRAARSRFGDAGCLIKADASQLEYRSAAWQSKDQALTEIFQRGADLHEASGRLLAEVLGIPYDSACRQAGKTINFLVIYLGNWVRLTQTVLELMGRELRPDQAQYVLHTIRHRSAGLPEWQDALVRSVIETGVTHLHIGRRLHFTRSFLGGEPKVQPNASTIVNFQTQSFAAALIEDAQIQTMRAVQDRGLSAVQINNRHDDGLYDVLQAERDALEAIIRTQYTDSLLIREHRDVTGWSVPLAVQITQLWPPEPTHA